MTKKYFKFTQWSACTIPLYYHGYNFTHNPYRLCVYNPSLLSCPTQKSTHNYRSHTHRHRCVLTNTVPHTQTQDLSHTCPNVSACIRDLVNSVQCNIHADHWVNLKI